MFLHMMFSCVVVCPPPSFSRHPSCPRSPTATARRSRSPPPSLSRTASSLIPISAEPMSASDTHRTDVRQETHRHCSPQAARWRAVSEQARHSASRSLEPVWSELVVRTL